MMSGQVFKQLTIWRNNFKTIHSLALDPYFKRKFQILQIVEHFIINLDTFEF